MSGIVDVLAVVYGSSLVVTAGGGVLWLISPKFRRLLIDSQAS